MCVRGRVCLILGDYAWSLEHIDAAAAEVYQSFALVSLSLPLSAALSRWTYLAFQCILFPHLFFGCFVVIVSLDHIL